MMPQVKNESELFIGVMSGTSVDGIDVAIVSFKGTRTHIVHAQCMPFEKPLKDSIQTAIEHPNSIGLNEIGQLNAELGFAYAQAIQKTLSDAQLDSSKISGIGCHGQTLLHSPNTQPAFSIQLGDANIIAEHTHITTVNNFRARDIAAGGQGAPLVPAFHAAFFAHEPNCAVLNIGGISNISILPNESSPKILGFDVGVGNALMDHICQQFFDCDYDPNGQLAQKGTINTQLLESLCSDDYFKLPPPKSTGRELFNPTWLAKHLKNTPNISRYDTLRTLTEFTVWGITHAIAQHAPNCGTLILCGGGAYNTFLIQRIREHLDSINVTTSDEYGLPAKDVEAVAFAWLAKQTLSKKAGNSPSATHAKGERILGAIHLA